MSNFTNIGLVEFVKKALSEKWGYVWGTFGQTLTPTILEQKRKQYPSNIEKHLNFIKENWLGRRTADCVNLIKAYLWWKEDKNNPVYSIEHDKVDGVWMNADGAFYKATEKGSIDTIPELPGIIVYYKGHVGIYVGNDEVIEARGTNYGVVKTKLKDRPWTHWFKYPGIKYIDEIEYYRKIIQENVGFHNPEGVWAVMDTHPFAKALYQQWANSYSKKHPQ